MSIDRSNQNWPASFTMPIPEDRTRLDGELFVEWALRVIDLALAANKKG
jgi:hypothetical protein